MYEIYKNIISLYYDSTDCDDRCVWITSITCACLIGVCSKLPLVLISLTNDNRFTSKDSLLLKYLLSFAVGGLLGDVFFDLMPEAHNQLLKSGVSNEDVQRHMGFWILCGIFTFGIIEMICNYLNVKNQEDHSHENGHLKQNDTIAHVNTSLESEQIKVTGYLSLFLNAADNFAHGLAVGASFLVSIKTGLLTTFAVIIHEIPHEIGDFAILIKSGFPKWTAVKAQVSIASMTILGTVITLWVDFADGIDIKIAWILPFTCGGFLYIALTNIMPELVSETNIGQSLRQSLAIATGISVMLLIDFI